MGKTRKLNELGEADLLKRRTNYLVSLEKYCSQLEKFVHTVDGPLITNAIENTFERFQGHYTRAYSNVELINGVLSPYLKIKLNPFDDRYSLLIEEIDRKNASYIRKVCDTFLEGLTDDELRKKAELSTEGVMIREVKTPKVS